MTLNIKNLRVSREGPSTRPFDSALGRLGTGKEIIKGVSLDIPAGELHALMGPNGSGKSSLAAALMGHPKYEVTSGEIALDGEDITALAPNERAKRGLFLSLQNPPEIAGASVPNFLRTAVNAGRQKPVGVLEFHKLFKEKIGELKFGAPLLQRGINEGFSGGEKKRAEILQLSLLEPKYAILDEIDSGLDVDAIKIVTEEIAKARSRGAGILLITHYAKILQYLAPDRVHVLVDGKIAASGGSAMAEEIEKSGYAAMTE